MNVGLRIKNAELFVEELLPNFLLEILKSVLCQLFSLT